MIRVLCVDDEPRILDGLRRTLHARRRDWSMSFLPGGTAALEECARAAPDVVVTDLRMPEIDGLALLALVRERWPATLRIVLSGQSDADSVMGMVRVAHQFMTKPCDVVHLAQAVARVEWAWELVPEPALRAAIGGAAWLPARPAAQLMLAHVLSERTASVGEVASIVGADPALAAKTLQLVNSSFFGVLEPVCVIRDAVQRVGLNALQALLQAGLLADDGSLWTNFPADAWATHAVATARSARAACPDPRAAEEAYLAGLLHGVGAAVIALTGALESWIEPLNVRRAAAGAALLALWGLPRGVLDAVAGSASGDGAGACSLARLVREACLSNACPARSARPAGVTP